MRVACGCIAVLSLISIRADADSFQMSMLETEDLRLLYFDPPQTYLVPHVARSFHNSLVFQEEVLGWVPYEETTVLLKDFGDYGNAAARSAPDNAIMIDVAPLSRAFETFTASERMYMLMNHELAHVATMDSWNEQDRSWRKFFAGKPIPTARHPESIFYSYMASPRVAVPRWYLEGSAVFLETWMSGGLGRAQGAYDEMVFRSMVADDAHFYGPLGLVSEGTKVDFQVGVNSYLYGTRFISYLGLEHSPEKVIEWLQRGPDSERYYSKQFEKVFEMPIETAWNDWIGWEHEFQDANLARIDQFPTTQYSDLTSVALGSVSRPFLMPDEQLLLGGFRYPGVVAHLGTLSIKDGTIEHLTDIKGPMLYRVTALAFDSSTQTAFYTADNNAFRDLMEMHLGTGDRRMLIRDSRIGELVFNPTDKSLLGVRHLNGYATLVRIPAPYDKWEQIRTWPYGESLCDLDISPDGQLLSMSVGEINSNQSLRVFRLSGISDDQAEPIAQFDFGTAVPEGFVFSPDGRYLFGSSYYTGVSNIFRYELETGDLEAVSNAVTGFFRPLPLRDGSLIVYRYTGNGFVPARIDPEPLEDVSAIVFLGAEIAREHPVVQDWQVGSPADIPLDDLVTNRGTYKPYQQLGLMNAFPVLEGFKDSVAVGWHFNFQDPMLFNSLQVTASYGPDDSLPSKELTHINVEYDMLSWRAQYSHNGASFYDLFGPTKRSRAGDAYILGYDRALIYDMPRRLDLETSVAYYTGIDTLPNDQNIPTISDELASFYAELRFQNTRHSLGHVDEEKGYRWNLAVGVDRSGGETASTYRGDFDFGFALPWKHSSIWLLSSAGTANGSRSNPYASFYFGAFGNNYVDDGEVKRYREYNSFPGFEIDALSGQSYVKSTLEWNLPPKRFRNVGTPGFYLTHLRPALFLGALVTDPDDDTFRRTLTDLGFQVDLHFTIVHRLDMTLSLGYAAGFEQGNQLDNEWILSLKVL